MSETESIRLSSITCSDKRMDIVDTNRILDTPINKYEESCKECHFPNIDKTPEPYYIAKGRDFSGIEIMEADLGNLFVSNRLKKVLEILFPNQFNFQKTFIQNTSITTKWWLAIPINKVISGEVKEDVNRCKVCNQPLHAHPGTQYKFWIRDFEAPFDIIKAKNWYSMDENDWTKWWIGRDVFLSVRLISFLKRISAKGIYQYAFSKFKQLTKTEKVWIEQALSNIGELKNKVNLEITNESIENFKDLFSIKDNRPSLVKEFERKFKINASELATIICNVKSGTTINIGFDAPFTVEQIEAWEQTKTKKNLISFAFDDFGNSLLFDPKEKACPIYYFDHETMVYDLVQETILNLTNS